LQKLGFRDFGGGHENDTNAHVLTQHELKLQCKFVQKRWKN